MSMKRPLAITGGQASRMKIPLKRGIKHSAGGGGGPAPGFSPSVYFAPGDWGFWIDPAKKSTKFASSNHTGPAIGGTSGDLIGSLVDDRDGTHLAGAATDSYGKLTYMAAGDGYPTPTLVLPNTANNYNFLNYVATGAGGAWGTTRTVIITLHTPSAPTNIYRYALVDGGTTLFVGNYSPATSGWVGLSRSGPPLANAFSAGATTTIGMRLTAAEQVYFYKNGVLVGQDSQAQPAPLRSNGDYFGFSGLGAVGARIVRLLICKNDLGDAEMIATGNLYKWSRGEI